MAEAPQVSQDAVPPGVDPAAYAKQMEDRANGVQPPQQGEKLLAGKYKTVEELEKGYAELMRMQGGKPQTPEQPAQQQAPQGQQQQEPTVQAAQQAVENAGLDFGAMSAEYAEKGELSEETLKALEAKGIPRDVTAQFLTGQAASRQIARAEVHKIVGGEDSYTQVVTWAKDNLSPEEITAFNKIANGNDLTATKMAVQGLKSRYDSAFGSEPTFIADNLGTGGPAGYRSKAEMSKDMSDPRYGKDEAFRRDVMQKLRATTAF